MPKIKVYDIKPPKRKQIKTIPPVPKRRFPIFKKIVASFLILLILFLVAREFISAQKTTIEITPKSEKTSFEVFLTANDQTKEIDLISQTLPLKYLEDEIVLTKKFKTTQEEVKERARGVIRVYNKYHLPVTLIANTRFQSSTEPPRVFLATKKFTVPANGYKDIEVVAAEPGEEYNIEPTSFSVPGLRKYSLTLFYNVYGKSYARMEGGRVEKVYKIKEEDVEKAKNALLESVNQEVVAHFKEKLGEEYFILEKTLQTEILEERLVDAQVGQEKEEFTYQVKVRAKIGGVAFSHILEFGKEYILSKIPPEKQVNPEAIKIKNLESNVDVEGTITLAAEFEGEIYTKIDELAIKEVAKSQTPRNIRKYIHEIYPEISEEPIIKFKPFFAKRASRDPSDIDIILNFK